MNYDQLFSFVAFADHLNFTRAARALHLSQPALFAQIKKLGEAVGRPLYRKRGRALALTAEGERLAAFGREARDRGDAVLAEIRGAALTGPVILASGQGAFQYLLGDAIRRFPKEKWSLRLVTANAEGAVELVASARAHVGVVARDAPPPDLEATRLCVVRQQLIVPPSHRLARRTRARLEDLDGERLVVAPEGSPHRTMLAQALRAVGVAWEVAVEATGWELMMQFARYGLGLAVVNDFCAPPPGTVAVPLAGPPPIAYWAIARPGPRSAGVEALRRLVIERV